MSGDNGEKYSAALCLAALCIMKDASRCGPGDPESMHNLDQLLCRVKEQGLDSSLFAGVMTAAVAEARCVVEQLRDDDDSEQGGGDVTCH